MVSVYLTNLNKANEFRTTVKNTLSSLSKCADRYVYIYLPNFFLEYIVFECVFFTFENTKWLKLVDMVIIAICE